MPWTHDGGLLVERRPRPQEQRQDGQQQRGFEEVETRRVHTYGQVR